LKNIIATDTEVAMAVSFIHLRIQPLPLLAIAEIRQGRTGIYDVRVTNQNDDVIAEFRGCSRTIKGQLFKE
jgi:predicted GH43/DUF377 family glycosyl hydrolase